MDINKFKEINDRIKAGSISYKAPSEFEKELLCAQKEVVEKYFEDTSHNIGQMSHIDHAADALGYTLQTMQSKSRLNREGDRTPKAMTLTPDKIDTDQAVIDEIRRHFFNNTNSFKTPIFGVSRDDFGVSRDDSVQCECGTHKTYGKNASLASHSSWCPVRNG